MSAENVALVRQVFDAWARGDAPAALELFDEAVEWDLTHHDWPGPDLYLGREGVIEVLAEWVGAFDEYELEAERLIDAGDKVVAVQVERGTTRGSRAPVERRTASVYTVREGRITRAEHYLDLEPALEAAGVAG